MTTTHIIVGSMLGGTEYVGEAIVDVLNENNINNTLHLTPDLDRIDTKQTNWIICCSTHGAGDYPDNIQAFIRSLDQTTNDLSTVNFVVLGTGDSNYDTYCMAAKNIEKLLISKNCNKLALSFHIDMQEDIDPEEVASSWIRSHIQCF